MPLHRQFDAQLSLQCSQAQYEWVTETAEAQKRSAGALVRDLIDAARGAGDTASPDTVNDGVLTS